MRIVRNVAFGAVFVALGAGAAGGVAQAAGGQALVDRSPYAIQIDFHGHRTTCDFVGNAQQDIGGTGVGYICSVNPKTQREVALVGRGDWNTLYRSKARHWMATMAIRVQANRPITPIPGFRLEEDAPDQTWYLVGPVRATAKSTLALGDPRCVYAGPRWGAAGPAGDWEACLYYQWRHGRHLMTPLS